MSEIVPKPQEETARSNQEETSLNAEVHVNQVESILKIFKSDLRS